MKGDSEVVPAAGLPVADRARRAHLCEAGLARHRLAVHGFGAPPSTEERQPPAAASRSLFATFACLVTRREILLQRGRARIYKGRIDVTLGDELLSEEELPEDEFFIIEERIVFPLGVFSLLGHS